jgi:hypothetical protein
MRRDVQTGVAVSWRCAYRERKREEELIGVE